MQNKKIGFLVLVIMGRTTKNYFENSQIADKTT
jgi:hypothetical protein